MPVMDGIALALAAVRDYPDLVILLMTGYADQRERAYGLETLIHDVIAKPLTIADLRATVPFALAARGSTRRSERCVRPFVARRPPRRGRGCRSSPLRDEFGVEVGAEALDAAFAAVAGFLDAAERRLRRRYRDRVDAHHAGLDRFADGGGGSVG